MKKLMFATLIALASGAVLADPVVTDPWVRATVPGQKATGAFLSLRSEEPVQLVGAATPVAGVVEIHEMRMEGNVMRMSPIPALSLSAGQSVVLKPGSYHIMLMDLKRPLAAGEKLPLTLRFEDAAKKARSIEVSAEVRELSAPPVHKHGGAGGSGPQ